MYDMIFTRKKVILSVILILMLTIAWGFYLYFKPRASIVGTKADISIPATSLYSEFETIEDSATKKYTDKILEINGSIQELIKTDTTLNIILNGGMLGGINCNMYRPNNETLALKKGDSILIKGRCSGFLSDVILVDAVLVKSY